MDINSKKGQVSLADEQLVAEFVEKQLCYKYVQTPKNMPAAVDAILIEDGIKAVVETKCRYDIDSIDYFKNIYKSEWLVTWEKINKSIQIASGMCVPCVGMLFLVKPKMLLIQRISNPNGNIVPSIRLQTTSTQATINGGLALRTNAYIDMQKAKVYKL